MGKLLWARTTEAAADAAAKNKYYLIGPHRVLAYGNKSGGGLERATDAVVRTLNETEREWLQATLQKVSEGKARDNWQEITESQREFMTRFEQELEAERRKADGAKQETGEKTGEGEAGRTEATGNIRQLG